MIFGGCSPLMPCAPVFRRASLRRSSGMSILEPPWVMPRSTPRTSSPITGPSSPAAGRCGLGKSTATSPPAEWDQFLHHFELRKVALGVCTRDFGTVCAHEHSCIRCPLLRPDPAQMLHLQEIRDNLTARIAEAH